MSLQVGEELANIGTATALVNKDYWSDKADAWLAGLPFDTLFTSEDLVNTIGLPTHAGLNANNAIGAKMRTWSHQKMITRVGFEKATRSVSHGRFIAVWTKE